MTDHRRPGKFLDSGEIIWKQRRAILGNLLSRPGDTMIQLGPVH